MYRVKVKPLFTTRYRWAKLSANTVRFDCGQPEIHLFNGGILEEISKMILKTYVGRRYLFLPTSLFLDDIRHRIDRNQRPSRLMDSLSNMIPTDVLVYYDTSVNRELNKLLADIQRQLRPKIICDITVTPNYTMIAKAISYTYY